MGGSFQWKRAALVLADEFHIAYEYLVQVASFPVTDRLQMENKIRVKQISFVFGVCGLQ